MAAAPVAEVSATKTEAVKPSTVASQGRSKICRTRKATKISDLGTLAEEQTVFSLTVMGGGAECRAQPYGDCSLYDPGS